MYQVVHNLLFYLLLAKNETWLFTLRQEHRLRLFENRMLGDEVTESWRILCEEGVHNLYFSSDIVSMIRSRM
jgi:hypothetical protein